MKRAVGLLSLVMGVLAAASCGQSDAPSDDPYSDEFVDSSESFLTKCQNPALNGQGNFCDDPACPCILGEGDCDADAQCVAPYACRGKGTYFGFATNFNVCAGAHCNNKRKDGDETKIDCGGSCGTFNCPATDACDSVPPSGSVGHCTSQCPCPSGQGACSANNTCLSGLVCGGSGTPWGFPSSSRVCQASHCINGISDGNETGVDCGGSCAPCGGAATGLTRYGGPSSDLGMAVAYDSAGNTIVAGRFGGTINLGGGNLISAGNADVFVAKFAPSGAHVWSRAWGGTGPDADQGLGVAVGPGDTVYVGGNYYYSADFGGGVRPAVDTSDGYLVKLDSAGTHIWSRTFGGMRGDKVQGVAVHTDGSVYITGSFQETINLGGSTFTSASAGVGAPWDIFVAKLDTNGTHRWSHAFGSATDDQGTSIAVDSVGVVYVGGYFSSTVNFAPTSLTSLGSTEAFVMRLANSNGARNWVRRLGGTGADRVNAVAVAGTGGPAFVGTFRSTIDLGSGPIASQGSLDGFVVSLHPSSGAPIWGDTFGGLSGDYATGVVVQPNSKNVAVSGYFKGTMTSAWGNVNLVSNGVDDVFLIRYTSTGTVAWATSYGGTSSDIARGIALRGSDTVVVGNFSGSMTFSGSTLTSAGSNDIFVVRQTL